MLWPIKIVTRVGKEILENKIFPKIGLYKYQQENLKRFNDEFVEEVLKYRPTVLVVIRGDYILKDSLLKLREISQK